MRVTQRAPSQQQEPAQSAAPEQSAPEEQAQGNAAAGQDAAAESSAPSPTPTLDVANEEGGGGGGGDQAMGSGGQAAAASGGGGGATAPSDAGGGGGGGGGAAASGGGGGGGNAAAQASQPPRPIEGADTKAYAEAYKAATPTEKAASYAEVGPKMDELSKSEQGEMEEGIPEYHATMVDNMPLTEGGDVAVETPNASGEVDDGGTGQIEDPEIQETQDLGEFPGNQGAGDAVGGMSDESSEEQRASAISSEMSSMTTADGAVETSPGPTPPVPLEGDTDLQRTSQAMSSSGTEAGEAHTEARQAVVDGPGQEQVQPIVMDEINIVADVPDVNIDTPNAIAEMDQYTNLPTQAEIQPAFDELYADEMEASAAEAQTQIDDAVSTRDVDSAAELTRAEAEHQQLVTDAETEQDRAVSEGRSEIDSQRQQAMTDQEAAVSDFRSSAQSEHQSRSMEAERRISADETRIRSEYDAAQTEAEGEVRRGEEEAQREKERKEREAENQSWWDRAVSAISDLVSAIADAINSIFDAVREAVSAVLDAVKDLACSIIDAACSFICSLIEAFGEFLKALVTNLLGAIFPEIAAALCAAIDAAVDLAQQAVQAAADLLKAGVAALCDAVNAAINAIISAYQAAVNAALAVMQAVLTGDWMAILIMALEAALNLCGISPDEFYALIGQMEATIETIVNDPGAFLSNCLDAVGQGFSQFGDNFLDHLQTGFIEWLTGQAGDTGITMPDNFDLAGIFSIVLQVMGLTYDRIREKAVELIGEQNVALLEFVWGFISAAIEGGLDGLWEHVQGQLDSLWDMVIGAIQEWIMTRIVMAAIEKLATMWNPFGAIVQAILTAWDLYCFLRDEIQRIFGVVQAVVNTISDIASGNIGGAANLVEQALADLVPIAISLLANLIGLGGIGAKVREIIEGIQDTVWNAIDALIQRVIGLFGGGNSADEGETPGDSNFDGTVGEEISFSAEGESHRLWIDASGSSATVMIASTPMPVPDRLSNWEGRLNDPPSEQDGVGGPPEERRDEARGLIGTARTQHAGVDQAAEEVLTAESDAKEREDNEAEAAERALANTMRQLFEVFADEAPRAPLDSEPTSFTARTGENNAEESHQIRISDGPQPQLMIASREAPARVQVTSGEFAGRIPDDQVTNLQSLIDQVDAAIVRYMAAPTAELNAIRGEVMRIKSQVTAILVEAGQVFELPDIGTHTAMQGAARIHPDGHKQESHHVPGFELGNTMQTELTETAGALQTWRDVDPEDRDFVDDAVTMLRSKASAMAAPLRSRGGALAAILIHPHTHRLGESGSPGAHNVDIGPEAEALLAAGEARFEAEVIRITTSSGMSVNPQNAHWRQQLRETCNLQDRQAGVSGREDQNPCERWVDDTFAQIQRIEDMEETKFKTDLAGLINTTFPESYRQAWTHESSKVGAALRDSVVDGPQSEKMAVFGRLPALSREIWLPLIEITP